MTATTRPISGERGHRTKSWWSTRCQRRPQAAPIVVPVAKVRPSWSRPLEYFRSLDRTGCCTASSRNTLCPRIRSPCGRHACWSPTVQPAVLESRSALCWRFRSPAAAVRKASGGPTRGWAQDHVSSSCERSVPAQGTSIMIQNARTTLKFSHPYLSIMYELIFNVFTTRGVILSRDDITPTKSIDTLVVFDTITGPPSTLSK